MLLVVAMTVSKDKTQSVANPQELVVGHLEVNEDLLKPTHLGRGDIVKPQREAVPSQRGIYDATVNNIPLNRNFDVNAFDAWRVILHPAPPLQNKAIKRILISRVTAESDRQRKIAFISDRVIRNKFVFHSYGSF